MVLESATIPPWPDDPLPAVRAMGGRTVVALDDDPTGTQTVANVPVLTRWSADQLGAVLAARLPVVYILTNSRSLPPERARDLAFDLGQMLADATDAMGHGWSVVSRSDSTLRGHFPIEVDALADGLGIPDARVLLSPYLGDAGRVTLGGVHHVRRDEALIPVAETEFARDPVFGYRSSDLASWVVERVAAAAAPARTTSTLTLDQIRLKGPHAVRDALVALPRRGVLVVDAIVERDIEVVALGAALAEEAGIPLIGRTAGSFVRARAGLAQATLVDPSTVRAGVPGLVVVGSHVPTTTMQLERLLAEPPIPVKPIELDAASLVLDPGSSERAAAAIAAAADHAIDDGRTPVIHTSRSLVRASDPAGDLEVAALVSRTLVASVAGIRSRPRWVLAKGGITSSDVATDALGIVRAQVVGPLIPGVPVWRAGEESRWPGIAYLVFPGNVGDSEAVREAVRLLAGVPA